MTNYVFQPLIAACKQLSLDASPCGDSTRVRVCVRYVRR
jgi:hypothetical protein